MKIRTLIIIFGAIFLVAVISFGIDYYVFKSSQKNIFGSYEEKECGGGVTQRLYDCVDCGVSYYDSKDNLIVGCGGFIVRDREECQRLWDLCNNE